PSGVVEVGSAAQSSPLRADNSLFWIAADERGGGMAYRANGYSPQRISNHAVEAAWQSYGTISDCISYAEQRAGHTFLHFYFPSANKSWRYDVSLGMWHEINFWDSTNAVY